MKNYMKRITDELLNTYLSATGAAVIEGPKWCGKTTTALNVANSTLIMDNPDSKQNNLDLALYKPSLLLKGNTPRLIDEWQLAPQLWDCARHIIDKRQKQGQFIFTGSAVPTNSEEIIHSGAGRFAWLTMRTMSLYESKESTGEVSLKKLFTNPKNILGISNLDIEELSYIICRGGWPQAINMKKEIALMQAYLYYDAIIKSEINRADGINKNPERVKRIMRSFARNQCAQTSANTIKQDIVSNEAENTNENTILSYINALKKIFVIEDIPSWNPNLRSKTAIRTSDTRYYSDPSIGVAALGLGPNDLIQDIQTLGLFFEVMCIRDLRVYSQSINGEVFHYRDSYDLECDSVIHLKNGNYALIEIKLGEEKLIEKGAKNLIKLYNRLDFSRMKKPSFMMVLVGIGSVAYKRKDGIFVVPISCLKN